MYFDCVHMWSILASFRPRKCIVQVADGKTIVATGKDEVHKPVLLTVGGTFCNSILSDVVYAPQISNIIFSTSAFLTPSR